MTYFILGLHCIDFKLTIEIIKLGHASLCSLQPNIVHNLWDKMWFYIYYWLSHVLLYVIEWYVLTTKMETLSNIVGICTWQILNLTTIYRTLIPNTIIERKSYFVTEILYYIRVLLNLMYKFYHFDGVNRSCLIWGYIRTHWVI